MRGRHPSSHGHGARQGILGHRQKGGLPLRVTRALLQYGALLLMALLLSLVMLASLAADVTGVRPGIAFIASEGDAQVQATFTTEV